jgi:hypothetical protein
MTKRMDLKTYKKISEKTLHGNNEKEISEELTNSIVHF